MDHVVDLLLGPAGVTVLCLVIGYGGVKKYWVFGWAYKECIEEKNEWKEAALRGTEAALRGTRAAEKAVTDPVRGDL